MGRWLPARAATPPARAQMRYSAGGPLVLRGVDLDVAPGSRVSVVGRTGAGKSSLLAALLRLVEPCGGRVEVDGLDVARLPLRLLRQRVCVISQARRRRRSQDEPPPPPPLTTPHLLTQDPLFFTDTLRRNLDPFGEHPDGALLSVLAQVRERGRNSPTCWRRRAAQKGTQSPHRAAPCRWACSASPLQCRRGSSSPRRPGPWPALPATLLSLSSLPPLPLLAGRDRLPRCSPCTPLAAAVAAGAPSTPSSPSAAPTSRSGSSSCLRSRARSSAARASSSSTRPTRPSTRTRRRSCTRSSAAPLPAARSSRCVR